MKHLMRSSAIGVVLAAAAAATAALVGAPAAGAITPVRHVEPAPDDMVVTDQCAFPVLATSTGLRSPRSSPTGSGTR